MASPLMFVHLIFGCIFVIGASHRHSDQTVSELKQRHQLLSDELSMVKRKLWFDVMMRLNEVENNQKEVHNISQCSCPTMTSKSDGDDGTQNRYAALYKAFVEEKSKSRKVMGQIREIQGTMQALNEKITAFDHLSRSCDAFEEADVQRKLKSFKQPSYKSEWILMRAQDEKLSKVSFDHGLHEIPYKVEVQIRPDTGPNADWLFHGDSVFQSDDDTGLPYGGLIYLYNSDTVHVIAPKRYNQGDKEGAIINTGEGAGFRVGINHQISQSAYVRIKVWGSTDFPNPDFQTSWKPLDIDRRELSYYEIPHGLGDYPAFINFQLRCKTGSTFLISEGVGASLAGGWTWKTCGGVVWAFNDRMVRVWTAFQAPNSWKSEKASYPYTLLGDIDGWNFPENFGDNYIGEFRILAWSSLSAVPGRNFIPGSILSNWLAAYCSDSDHLSLYVQCEEGTNKGFRFKGRGNSQAQRSTFGGAVYAFRQYYGVRVWKPNPDKGGFLVHVHSPYGNDQNIQTTNNATFVVDVLKGYHF